ncbi:DUF3619 family protein [Azonexus hydrophilus]|jgi:hypothetical protein|uniref:DUF3619 family protein n=1 Tax=Azonexus hydrophilus TaxID=418702 RepID=A0ABZ2XEH5_9RHOO|nr:DUF3619 family protein [Dechloromonas sp.]
MNEERQAYRIRQVLNHGLRDVSPAASRRLEAARHMALNRQKQPEHQMVAELAGYPAGSPTIGGKQEVSAIGRSLLAILALLFGMWLAFHWHSERYVAEIEAIDSALLTDDLPPDVLLDRDFLEWLKDNSSED